MIREDTDMSIAMILLCKVVEKKKERRKKEKKRFPAFIFLGLPLSGVENL
jgi:hypothetical protein